MVGELMDSGTWLAGAALITLIGGAVVWLMRLQQKLDSKLSYEKHEEICTRAHAQKMAAIQELKEMIEANEKDAKEDRHEMRKEMHSLAIRFAEMAAMQRKSRTS